MAEREFFTQGKEVIQRRIAAREALAGAIGEAIRRGWSGPIVTQTGGGVYIVGGRDSKGIFHFGSARESWQAAFEDAERRDKEKGLL